MKKIAVLVEDHYQTLEVWYPYLRLREEGYKTVLVGTGRSDEYKSKEGYVAPEELSIERTNANDFDGVIIPGGYAPDMMRRNPKVAQFVRKIFEQGKLVASICHGGWILASADIVKGKTVTSFSAIKDDLIHAGANFVDEEVVVDKNIITSRNPYDLPAFCKEIVKFLKGKK